MTNKTTKRALLSSVVALFLCFAMLLGTTYAWFTDSATSANNIIKSGNLKINLEYWDGSAWKNVEGASDILTGDLWEPGYVDVAYLRVSNAGSLALKYQLGVNIVTETAGVNLAGDTYKLSDYIYFDVKEGINGEVAPLDRDGAMKIATSTTKISEGYSKAGELLANDPNGEVEYVYLAMIVYMPQNVGNAANHDGNTIPQIDLGVNVIATQMAAEWDSFGPDYDKDAYYTDAIVTSEEELVEALANAKNGAIIGIKGNVTWTTGASIGSTPFIESASTFAMGATSSTKNITLIGLDENATFTAIGAGVGAIGIDGGTVTFKDLKIVDESVSYAENNWEYGYLEFRGNTVFENCEIVNAIMMEGTSATFDNCYFNSNKASEYAVWVSDGNVAFEGCVFTGPRGIKIHEAYGSEVDAVTINNNTFVDLSEKPGLAIGTVNADTTIVMTNNTFAGTQAGDQGLYTYETDTDVTAFNFTYEGNVVADYVENGTDLNSVIKDNANVVLSGGEYALPSLNGKTGVTIEGAADGSTVIGGESASTGFGSNFGKDTTIKNVTFAGSTNGVRWSYANGGTSVFENCTFAGDSTYGFHIDASNGATFIFNNCTFSGFNAFAGDIVKIVFNNCTFLNNGNYGHTNIWSVAELNNCTFGDNTSISTAGKLYFDGVEESYHHEYIGSAESLLAFAESVNVGGDPWSGQKVILVDDINLGSAVWTPIGQTGATEFEGIFDGNNHTIYNLNVDNSAYTDEYTSSGLFGWAESGVTIQNVKINGAKIVGNHNVAVIVGYTYSGKIINCHVTNAEIVCNHANGDACGDKCGLIVGYAGNESRITGCTATDSTVTAGRDGGQLIGCGYNVSVSDCSATNVVVSATGDCNKEGNINNALIGRVMG